MYKELVEYLLKGIVHNPDAVVVSEGDDEMGKLVEVKVDPTDMGLAIGQGGSMIQAIRTVVRGFGARNKHRVYVKLFDPNPRPQRKEGYGDRPRRERPKRPLGDDFDFGNL